MSVSHIGSTFVAVGMVLSATSLTAEVIQSSNNNLISGRSNIMQFDAQGNRLGVKKQAPEPMFGAPNIEIASTDSIVSDNALMQLPNEPRASKAVLQAIDVVATKYENHAAIKAAGLTPKQWKAIFRANVWTESAYNITAKSHAGAIGLGQLMPGTARRFGVDPHDPMQNLDGSARYILFLLSEFRDANLAIAGYNAGEGAITKYGGIPPYAETIGHVNKVMRRASLLIKARSI